MLKKSKLVFITFIFLAGGCSPVTSIQRDVLPDKRPEAEILNNRTALIRTAESDISIVAISGDQWKEVLSSRVFTGTYGIEAQETLPADIFFFTLTNTTESSLTEISVSCAYSGKNVQALKSDVLNKSMNLSGKRNKERLDILSVRRLTSLDYEFDKIDFSKNTLLYPFKFVLPLDRICFLAAFPLIPKDQRHFIITLSYSTPAAKKKVDFKFTRFEHREEE